MMMHGWMLETEWLSRKANHESGLSKLDRFAVLCLPV
jgi:hypothetical protein